MFDPLNPVCIAEAPEHVQAKYDFLRNEDAAERGLRIARSEQVTELRRHLSNLRNQLVAAKKMTRPDKEKIAKLETDIKKVEAKISDLENKKSRTAWFQRVNDEVQTYHGDLIPVDPIEWNPRKGEDVFKAYEREYKLLGELQKARDKVKNAARPGKELFADVCAKIDGLAKIPDLGGLAARVKDGEIGFPRQMIYAGGSPEFISDPIALIAWLMGDELKKKLNEVIKEYYSPADAISDSEFAASVAEAEARLLHQLRVAEAAYMYGSQHGLRLNRHKLSRPCTILGVETFERFLD